MKLIHISDLHLGKRLNEFSLLEDQRYILKQILEICLQQKADAVLLAGDIYDRQVPSAEAVLVLDWFLTALSKQKISVFAVSGNHDSPERIAFGAGLMKQSGVHLSAVYDGQVTKAVLTDSFGPVFLYLLPFIRPAAVRRALNREDIESCQDAVKAAIEQMKVDPAQRNVLVAHQFVTGAGRCDSEDIIVGGTDNVDVSVFDAFDYTALGHIHSPQQIGTKNVRYCGTPLKYSVSEAGQEKSVTVVELGEKGDVKISTVSLKPLHDLRTIRGSYMQVMSRSFYEGTDTSDYVQITLTDEEDIPDGIQKLRTVYPNLLSLVYDNKRTQKEQLICPQEYTKPKTEQELFEELYETQNNQPMSTEQKAYIEALLKRLKEDGQ